MALEPGSAVEVSISDSLHSATIIRRLDSDRFLVHFNSSNARKVVCRHQLRPVPPPLSSSNLFDNHWWHRHVVTYDPMQFGSFKVKHHIHDHVVIIPNWVSPFIDRISEFPDIVLLNIMNFMDTKQAVQTCVLSKRWRHLCKRLGNLTFCPRPRFRMEQNHLIESFKKFVSWVFSARDDSYSVLNLNVNCWAQPQLLDKVVKYALVRDLQHLTLELCRRVIPNLQSLPLIFCCQTLTSLRLCSSVIILPKSLYLPALKSLHLHDVKFTATGYSAEPFSSCAVLDTLVLKNCSLHNDAQVLCISNSTLSSLTIFEYQAYGVVLSTPNLGSCTFIGNVRSELSSKCNLSFLRQVIFNTSWDVNACIIMKWMQVLANVKILALSVSAFTVMLRELSDPTRPKLQPPSFVRLKSLKVKRNLFLTEEKVNTFMEHLLQNSPMAGVDFVVLK